MDDVKNNGVTVTVSKQSGTNGLVLVNSFLFDTCSERGGNIRCKDSTTKSKAIFRKRSALDFFQLKIKVAGQTLTLPTGAETPLAVSVQTSGAVDRSDEVGNCKIGTKKVNCREVP